MATEVVYNTHVTRNIANGAAAAALISLNRNVSHAKHQIQIEVSAVPAAGSVNILAKSPGAALYDIIKTVDLTAVGTDKTKIELLVDGVFDSMQIDVTTDIDAGKTFNVFITSF